MSHVLQNKKTLFGILLTTICSPVLAGLQAAVSPEIVQQQLQRSSFPFIKNQGQQHKDVAFYATVPSGAVFVDKKGALVYSLRNNKAGWAFKENFSARVLTPKISQRSQLKLQQATTKSMQHITTANTLNLGEISQGVRVELQARNNNVEKLFYVSPGANPADIQVKLEGINASHINAQGELVLETGLGAISFTKPVAFQNRQGKKQFVDVAYALKQNQYSFVVADYDQSLELVIDPLIAATYLGGSDGYPTYTYDSIYSLVPVGDTIYAAGSTQSPDFPTALGYDSSFDFIRDGFVVRMSADLSRLLNATFIGGAVHDMIIDDTGEVVVAGQAYSGFPKTEGAYSYPSNYEQTGGFMAKLNADLTELVSAGVIVPAAAIQHITKGNGGFYFAGRHNINNLPVTANALQSACNCASTGSYQPPPYDGFLGRVSADLSSLDVLTWIAGDFPSAIAVASDSSVYVTDAAYTTGEGNIRQFDANISSVLAVHSFKYLGNAQTTFRSVALGNDFVLVGGTTKKNNLPATSGAFDSSCGSNGDCDNSDPVYYIAKADGFFVRYSMDLQTIEALTYFGGSGNDSIASFTLDETGNILFGGIAGDKDFPLSSDAYSKTGGAYFARMSNDLSRLLYSTKFDMSGQLTPATTNTFYISGSVSSSTNFPATDGAFDTTYNGGATDGFIALFDSGESGSGGEITPTPEPIPDPEPTPTPSDNTAPIANAGDDQTVIHKTKVRLDGRQSSDSDGNIVAWQWTQLDGKSVSITNATQAVASFYAPRTRRDKIRTLVFELKVTDDQGASDTDQVIITVTR
ncbi:MAG: PKD domain-containing protein [Gammaproteobacteria bacterium]|nr:PKD domain-containing protein [Gammaproteobacteria bacterium]